MKRVAIPVVKGKLSEQFENCNYCEIFEIDGDNVKSNEVEVPPRDISQLPEWAEKQGITDFIVYKINKNIIRLLTAKKINLFIGIKVSSPDRLIEDYMNGALRSDEKIIEEITAEKD
jgi:predicted Fe-Mo cluster-binding NifX family protein